ncbi:MAG: response regulator [Chloroflexota bacterium]|nr:response regulator [Chloroflexota bacterium]
MVTYAPALRVLFVDDDPDHAVLITRAIKESDKTAEIQTASDGTEALALLRSAEDAPDLVLLDINMPGLSGLDVLARIKEDAALRRLPVVMLTSSELSSDIARAYELGASGYISKPSLMHDLRAVLGNTLLYWSAMKRAPLRSVQPVWEGENL